VLEYTHIVTIAPNAYAASTQQPTLRREETLFSSRLKVKPASVRPRFDAPDKEVPDEGRFQW
jgi:hypothetical protein